jgi:hypothetical protein
LHYLVIRWLNAQRDSAVIGLLEGIPLSRTHRWQLFFDWVAGLTAESGSVRWFGYMLAALSGWAVLMLGLVGGVSDGMFIVRTLRGVESKQ